MSEPRTVRLLLAGYGTVGRALHQILQDDGDTIAARHGVRYEVAAIVRSRGAWVAAPGERLDTLPVADRQDLGVTDVIEQGVADVLVEVTPTDLGSAEPATAHMRAALEKGMHVVTANKGPVVVDYPGLMDAAGAAGRSVRFEATAGAAIPLMSLGDFCLRGNRVTRIEGILNGTSNYILTRMGEEGLAFGQALYEAQAMGYAEADPTADVGGHDAAAKVVILANHVLGRPLTLDEVHVTGIGDITGEAVQLALKQGYVLRLVATVGLEGAATVAPRLVPAASPLNVPGTLNVVRMHTAHGGPIIVTGHGAGGEETASAVLADLLVLPE